MEPLKRSSSMSSFWRALALPWRGGGGASGGSGGGSDGRSGGVVGSGRPPRASLDELGPSCGLGAALRSNTPSPRAEEGGSVADLEALSASARSSDSDAAPDPDDGVRRAPATSAAALPPPVPPGADARPRRKRAPLALNARGSEAALRSTNPIRKARPRARAHAKRRRQPVLSRATRARAPLTPPLRPARRFCSRWWTPWVTCRPCRTSPSSPSRSARAHTPRARTLSAALRVSPHATASALSRVASR
jgi:hypothetical protein